MCLRNVMITTFFCIGLITGIFHVSAQLSDSGIFGVQNIGIPLIPGHSGSDYIFIGDYSDGQIRILAPGLYYCTDNMRTTSEDYAIRLENQSVTLDGSGHQVMGSGGFCDGVQILPESYQCIIRNFSLISDFYHGIYSEGEYAFIHNNTIRNASAHGIQSRGNYSQIHFNTVEDTGDVCIFSYGDNSSLYHNYVFRGRNGILNHGNHADISRNYAINNYRYGIAAGGVFVGPDPGDTGKGYYTIMKDNIALMNGYSGLISYMPHGVVYDNIAIQNSRAGIDTTVRSNNTTLSGNMVMNNTLGIRISDQARDLIVRQNRITAHTQADLFILQNNSCGYGAIFDNYFGSLVHLDGAGHIENFTWTNPNGPTPGKNIISGPFIAGNYWSNPDGNGWSDIQAPTVTGYSQVPYEVKSGQGVYDTAPLVRIGHNVSSFADEWTIIHPIGNITYPRYSDPYYITQAKPGAVLNNLRVDGFLNASAPSYTFSSIDQDHIIETNGSPEQDQVHVRFTYSPSVGNYPLKVQFTDNSIGSPNSWYWQFGDGSNSTEKDPEHIYMIPGRYSVSLRAYNDITGGNSVCNNCITVL